MRFTLLANLAAVALFSALAARADMCRWEVLLFQLVLQVLTNEFWMDLFAMPFKGQRLFGEPGNIPADLARIHRVARWTSPFLLLFPACVLLGLTSINAWGDGALAQSLHLPLGGSLVLASLSAQGVVFVASVAGGLLPLSYRTLVDALMARRERRLREEGACPAAPAATSPPPVRAGVDALPHGLPAGVVLPACLEVPQRCSPLHAHHVELVRARLREGEQAILSTAPAGVVPLPSSSNERLFGSLGLCLAAALLYVAIGLFEEETSRVITRWVVVLLGVGLLPFSVSVLRASAHRQAALQRTDYILTNTRLHMCCAGRWQAASLVSMEVVPGGSYGEGCGDVALCPESGEETYVLVNVEHAEELSSLLERLVAMENAR